MICRKFPKESCTVFMCRYANCDCFSMTNLKNNIKYVYAILLQIYCNFIAILLITFIIESPPSFRIESLKSWSSFLVHILAGGTIWNKKKLYVNIKKICNFFCNFLPSSSAQKPHSSVHSWSSPSFESSCPFSSVSAP